tara:strand:- start:748 stop:1788 length:1041 start_codon:yes stop_codon:yes gene_type:complete
MSNIQINPYNFVAAGLGSWKELDRTTLAVESNTITVSGLDSKQYLMVLTQGRTAQTNGDLSFRYNGDSGANYASRQAWNGGSDNPYINQTEIRPLGTVIDLQFLNIDYISNLSGQEKLVIGSGTDNTVSGASLPPSREEHVAKWSNTSSSLSEVQAVLVNGTPNFRVGSEVVVLGYDPTDTHTTTDNFWQELSSTTLAVAATNFSSGTILAKKYLWVQVSIPSPNHNFNLQFNGDTGNNYAKRRSENGGTDTTSINQDRMTLGSYGSTDSDFYNIFIINNLANEKLAIIKNVNRNTAGAPNAPWRSEFASKWSNTSAQITTIDVLQQSGGAGSFGIGTIMKVWGHD